MSLQSWLRQALDPIRALMPAGVEKSEASMLRGIPVDRRSRRLRKTDGSISSAHPNAPGTWAGAKTAGFAWVVCGCPRLDEDANCYNPRGVQPGGEGTHRTYNSCFPFSGRIRGPSRQRPAILGLRQGERKARLEPTSTPHPLNANGGEFRAAQSPAKPTRSTARSRAGAGQGKEVALSAPIASGAHGRAVRPPCVLLHGHAGVDFGGVTLCRFWRRWHRRPAAPDSAR